MNHTLLHERHSALGARWTCFAGWEMPLFYKGILHEHHKVRQQAGLFDLSHMGRIEIKGRDSDLLLDYLSTNHIANKKEGRAIYTVWCNSSGGCIDDLLVYRIDAAHAFIVVNAGCRQKDLAHLSGHAKNYNVEIAEKWAEEGILALQGPSAEKIAGKLFPEVAELAPLQFATALFSNTPLIISRTGYTGAGGYEFFAPNAIVVELWDSLLEAGAEDSIEPIGLGARDTLRLEAGFALYGHELSEEIAAVESVASWAIRWDKNFLGKEAMEQLKGSSAKRVAAAFILQDKAIAREGSAVFKGGKRCGVVTSGGYSPTLEKPIALALLDLDNGSDGSVEGFTIQVRNKQSAAARVKLPFIPLKN